MFWHHIDGLKSADSWHFWCDNRMQKMHCQYLQCTLCRPSFEDSTLMHWVALCVCAVLYVLPMCVRVYARYSVFLPQPKTMQLKLFGVPELTMYVSLHTVQVAGVASRAGSYPDQLQYIMILCYIWIITSLVIKIICRFLNLKVQPLNLTFRIQRAYSVFSMPSHITTECLYTE